MVGVHDASAFERHAWSPGNAIGVVESLPNELENDLQAQCDPYCLPNIRPDCTQGLGPIPEKGQDATISRENQFSIFLFEVSDEMFAVPLGNH